MSIVENKVKWCLKKAEKELSQGIKHRGLIKTQINISAAKNHIRKAEHNFKALLLLEKNGFSDWATNAAFYTVYHCFLAIITKFGYESRNQECTIALIQFLKKERKIFLNQEIIDAMNIFLNMTQNDNLIELREEMQYSIETSIGEETLIKLKYFCREAIGETKQEVYNIPNSR